MGNIMVFVRNLKRLALLVVLSLVVSAVLRYKYFTFKLPLDQLAYKLYQKKSFENCQRVLHRLQVYQPENREIDYNIAVCEYKRGRFLNAYKKFEKLSVNGNIVKARANSALSMFAHAMSTLEKDPNLSKVDNIQKSIDFFETAKIIFGQLVGVDHKRDEEVTDKILEILRRRLKELKDQEQSKQNEGNNDKKKTNNDSGNGQQPPGKKSSGEQQNQSGGEGCPQKGQSGSSGSQGSPRQPNGSRGESSDLSDQSSGEQSDQQNGENSQSESQSGNSSDQSSRGQSGNSSDDISRERSSSSQASSGKSNNQKGSSVQGQRSGGIGQGQGSQGSTQASKMDSSREPGRESREQNFDQKPETLQDSERQTMEEGLREEESSKAGISQPEQGRESTLDNQALGEKNRETLQEHERKQRTVEEGLGREDSKTELQDAQRGREQTLDKKALGGQNSEPLQERDLKRKAMEERLRSGESGEDSGPDNGGSQESRQGDQSIHEQPGSSDQSPVSSTRIGQKSDEQSGPSEAMGGQGEARLQDRSLERGHAKSDSEGSGSVFRQVSKERQVEIQQAISKALEQQERDERESKFQKEQPKAFLGDAQDSEDSVSQEENNLKDRVAVISQQPKSMKAKSLENLLLSISSKDAKLSEDKIRYMVTNPDGRSNRW